MQGVGSQRKSIFIFSVAKYMGHNTWAYLHGPYIMIDYILRYGIAVSDPQHIVRVPDWPTISNTGSFPPESCIFSQIFNLCAFLGYFVSLTYYKFVQANGYNGKLNLGTVSITYDSYDMNHSIHKLKNWKPKSLFYHCCDSNVWYNLRSISRYFKLLGH